MNNQESEKVSPKTFYEQWPLYRKLYKEKAIGHFSIPRVIDLYCTICKADTNWKMSKDTPISVFNSTRLIKYICVKCDHESILYWIFEFHPKENPYVCKIGQHPPLDDKIETELREKLGEKLEIYYKEAIRCRNSSFGIGSMAYMRRIIEDTLHSMIEDAIKLAESLNSPNEFISQLNNAKEEHNFKKKLDILKDKKFPLTIEPEGKNPFAELHKLYSIGLHNKTEDECLDIFDNTLIIFEHLFLDLEYRAKKLEKYIRALNNLSDIT